MRREARRTAEWYASLPLDQLQSLAHEGLEARAMLELAYRLAHGTGEIPQNSRAALRWYIEAAELGSAEAMYNLSICYLRGFGARRSLARSRYWAQQCEQRLGTHSADDLGGSTGGVRPASTRRVCASPDSMSPMMRERRFALAGESADVQAAGNQRPRPRGRVHIHVTVH